eukprot:GHUV01020007.1.p1 GENE.GHUV01020007.1~~GHUV01020007.1.p1  ORF type:complete len:457 (+),score=130.97 GHUV01020007.1:1014-2384(+)
MIKTANNSWRLPHIGELCCRRPALADTLDKIAQQGASYLSSPAVAAAMTSDLAAAGGIITAQDFERYKPATREPLRVQLGELELLIPPPPSSAAVVAFALKFLSSYGNTLQSSSSTNASATAAPAGPGGTATGGEVLGPNGRPLASFGANAARDGGLGLHHMVEAMKHGFAVRTALGDPGTPEQPFDHADSINAAVADLLSDDFVAQLRAMTRDNGVIAGDLYGGRWNPLGAVPANESGTSHLCVVDKDRNAVSFTTSVNGPFGSGVISESTGILFGNTMDDFAQPNKSSIVTPHPAEANFIAPGKRPLSAMSPIIVTHKATGRLVALAGASGGPLIVSATLQTLARLLLEGADVSEAVSDPRLHDQLLPKDDMYYENFTWGHTSHQLPADMVQYLKQRGQAPTAAGGYSLGISQAIHVLYDQDQAGTSSSGSTGTGKGLLVGQSDSRKDGAPVGY